MCIKVWAPPQATRASGHPGQAIATRIGLVEAQEGSWQACPPLAGLPAGGGPRGKDPPEI